LLQPSDTIVGISYYTALIWAWGDDEEKPKRQRTYLRALRTLPNLSIHLGRFRSHVVRMPIAQRPGRYVQYVDVVKVEEKGSDVNLATHLLHDAHLNRYDTALVVSNDSDLLEPIRLVRVELDKTVGLLVPGPHPSKDLARYVTFMKRIREGVLRLSQFPVVMTDEHGTFRKPIGW
jgi:uncharacterized LabA/DUF88 family protein